MQVNLMSPHQIYWEDVNIYIRGKEEEKEEEEEDEEKEEVEEEYANSILFT